MCLCAVATPLHSVSPCGTKRLRANLCVPLAISVPTFPRVRCQVSGRACRLIAQLVVERPICLRSPCLALLSPFSCTLSYPNHSNAQKHAGPC